MNFNNFTIKSQEMLQKAVRIASDNGNQAVEPVHLMKALLGDESSVVKFILQKLDVPTERIEQQLDDQMRQLPHVNGGEPYLSNDATKVLEKAEELAVKLTDNRRKMLATIIQNPSVSKEELAHIIGISTTAIDKNIDVMRGKLICRVGPDKGGHWEVLK